MARRIETEITGDASSFTRAADDAAGASDQLQSTWDRLQQQNEQLGDSFEKMAAKMDPDSSGVFDVDDAFGNLERVLIGVGDQLGVLEEQFGVNLGPMREYVQAGADVAGGMEGIIGGGRALVTQFGNIAPSLGPAIAATWAHVTALGAQAVAMIAANWPILAIIAAIALLAGGIILLVQHWDTITQKVPMLGAAVDAVVGVVTGALPLVTGAFQAVLDWVTNNWPIIAALIAAPFAPLIILATDGFGIRTAMINFVTALPGELRDGIGDVASTLRDKGTGIIQGFLDGMSEVFTTAWNFVAAIPGELVSAVGDVGALLWNAGRALISGLWDGISSRWAEVKDDVMGIVDPRNWDIPGRSPLLEAMDHTGHDAGVAFVEGMTRGINVSADSATGAARDLVGNVDAAGRVPWDGTGEVPAVPWYGTGEAVGQSGPGGWGRNHVFDKSGNLPVLSFNPYEGMSSTPSGNIASYIGADQTRALATAPKVGDTFNGMVWTGTYWSQAGARMLEAGEYTGFIGGAPLAGSAEKGVQIIQVTLDGAVIAEAVNKENARAY